MTDGVRGAAARVAHPVCACTGTICTADRAHRAAARVAHEEEAQALARTWRNLQRSLSGERGLWADASSREALHWKLDKTEDPSRRRAPLPPLIRRYMPVLCSVAYQHLSGTLP